MKKIRIKWYVALKNHIFRFYDQAAGDIAALFMVWWDKTFKQKVVEELKLYSRYVDDEHIIQGGPIKNKQISNYRHFRIFLYIFFKISAFSLY